jgi:hypothetical protein
MLSRQHAHHFIFSHLLLLQLAFIRHPLNCQDLEPGQVQSVYESMGQIVQSQTEPARRQQLLYVPLWVEQILEIFDCDLSASIGETTCDFDFNLYVCIGADSLLLLFPICADRTLLYLFDFHVSLHTVPIFFVFICPLIRLIISISFPSFLSSLSATR